MKMRISRILTTIETAFLAAALAIPPLVAKPQRESVEYARASEYSIENLSHSEPLIPNESEHTLEYAVNDAMDVIGRSRRRAFVHAHADIIEAVCRADNFPTDAKPTEDQTWGYQRCLTYDHPLQEERFEVARVAQRGRALPEGNFEELYQLHIPNIMDISLEDFRQRLSSQEPAYLIVHPSWGNYFSISDPEERKLRRNPEFFLGHTRDINTNTEAQREAELLQQAELRSEMAFFRNAVENNNLVILALPAYRGFDVIEGGELREVKCEFENDCMYSDYIQYINQITQGSRSMFYFFSQSYQSGRISEDNALHIATLLENSNIRRIIFGGGYIGRCQESVIAALARVNPTLEMFYSSNISAISPYESMGRNYDGLCTRPSLVIDLEGFRTDFEWDPRYTIEIAEDNERVIPNVHIDLSE